MRWPSESRERGAALLEVLATLAIASLLIGAMAYSYARPGDGLRLKRDAARLANVAALARIEAMELGAMVPLDIHEAEIGGRTDCEGGEPSIRFMADGGAVGTDICLTRGDLFARYRPDWLTGRLVETEPGR